MGFRSSSFWHVGAFSAGIDSLPRKRTGESVSRRSHVLSNCLRIFFLWDDLPLIHSLSNVVDDRQGLMPQTTRRTALTDLASVFKEAELPPLGSNPEASLRVSSVVACL